MLEGQTDIRPLTSQEFERIRILAREKFGLDLRSGKEELVSARLGKHLRRLGFRTFEAYHRHVLADASGEALTELIDALTTNYTSFLREPAHFDLLTQLASEYGALPRLRIWSAACSTGEEPYSIAITLLEAFQGRFAPEIEIVATDISTRVLETAERAVYPGERFSGFPPDRLQKYFLRGHGKWQGSFRLKPEVRRLVKYRRLNLTQPFPPDLPAFSVIFCRNVMIYFDRATQDELVARLAQRLEPGGYLLTGHSESLMGTKHPLEYVRPAVYRKPGGNARRPAQTRNVLCKV